MCVTNKYPVDIGSLQKADAVLDNLRSTYDDVTLNSTIYVDHTISVLGQTYRTGSVLVLNVDNRGEIVFGKFLHIIHSDVCKKFLQQSTLINIFILYAVQQPKAAGWTG